MFYEPLVQKGRAKLVKAWTVGATATAPESTPSKDATEVPLRFNLQSGLHKGHVRTTLLVIQSKYLSSLNMT